MLGKELRSWGYLKSLHNRERFGATPGFVSTSWHRLVASIWLVSVGLFLDFKVPTLLPNRISPDKKSSNILKHGCFQKLGVPPNHPFVHRVCHSKPSILGYPYVWKHPHVTKPQLAVVLEKSQTSTARCRYFYISTSWQQKIPSCKHSWPEIPPFS